MKPKYVIIILWVAVLAMIIVRAFTSSSSTNEASTQASNRNQSAQTVSSDSCAMQAVDLGLSVKWASCNLGAEKPENFGNYYAWGEVAPKVEYTWSTYKYAKDSLPTKYCSDSTYGYNSFTDSITTLTLEDDAAHVNWGDNWRMPTYDEWGELHNECTWTWTVQNEVNGYQVTSKKNGNSIFLPAAGYRIGSDTIDAGEEVEGNRRYSGRYWSSFVRESDPDYAWYFYFGEKGQGRSIYSRRHGFSVRPVCQ